MNSELVSRPSPGASLSEWLDYISALHHRPIDMTLDRVQVVKDRLSLDADAVKFIVGGTNGKGSTCALLEGILVQAGFTVGTYTSPHLLDFNERARVNGAAVEDHLLTEAFDIVEQARTQMPVQTLTYFEFTTLAICHVFASSNLDAWVLEVGLGGRLDAVNVFDADCAICTSVDIDHKDFLGDTREKIGFEKAGIFRSGVPAVIGDPQPPESMLAHAESIGADVWCFGRDYNYSGDKQQWAYGGRAMRRAALPYPALRGANQLLNASAALAALESVKHKLPVPAQSIKQGLLLVELPGRFQVLPGQPTIILDVGHNPHAAAHLRESLDNMGFYPYTHCILGMLEDKDAEQVIKQLHDRVDHWHLVTLDGERGRSADSLELAAREAGVSGESFDWAGNAKALGAGGIPKQSPDSSLQKYDSVAQAYSTVTQAASSNDRILIFGSFVTVAQGLQAHAAARKKPL